MLTLIDADFDQLGRATAMQQLSNNSQIPSNHFQSETTPITNRTITGNETSSDAIESPRDQQSDVTSENLMNWIIDQFDVKGSVSEPDQALSAMTKDSERSFSKNPSLSSVGREYQHTTDSLDHLLKRARPHDSSIDVQTTMDTIEKLFEDLGRKTNVLKIQNEATYNNLQKAFTIIDDLSTNQQVLYKPVYSPRSTLGNELTQNIYNRDFNFEKIHNTHYKFELPDFDGRGNAPRGMRTNGQQNFDRHGIGSFKYISDSKFNQIIRSNIPHDHSSSQYSTLSRASRIASLECSHNCTHIDDTELLSSKKSWLDRTLAIRQKIRWDKRKSLERLPKDSSSRASQTTLPRRITDMSGFKAAVLRPFFRKSSTPGPPKPVISSPIIDTFVSTNRSLSSMQLTDIQLDSVERSSTNGDMVVQPSKPYPASQTSRKDLDGDYLDSCNDRLSNEFDSNRSSSGQVNNTNTMYKELDSDSGVYSLNSPSK